MKPEKKADGKTGLSYELLLFITITEPFELIAVHFLVSRYNNCLGGDTLEHCDGGFVVGLVVQKTNEIKTRATVQRLTSSLNSLASDTE